MSDEENFSVRSKEYTKSEIVVIADLYQKIVKVHKDCDGDGAMLNDDDLAVDCDCVVAHRFIRELIFSRLPRRFWEVPLDIPFNKLLDDNLSLLGSGGAIHGMPSSGKTRFLTYLGKYFLTTNKSVVYFKMSDLENFVKNENDSDSIIYLERLYGSEIVLLDEVENFEYGKDFWVSKKIERVLDKVHDAGNSIYFTSSLPNIQEIVDMNPGLGKLCMKVSNDGSNTAIVSNKKLILQWEGNFLKKSFIKEANLCL